MVRAPIVRPWNAPRRPTVSGRCLFHRASLSAASTLSVPLLVKKTFFSKVPGVISVSFCGEPGLVLVVEVRPREVHQLGRPVPGRLGRRSGGNGRC